ncbi:MAG: hypothetical protein OXN90_12575 [Gemmatimonadota bacterium]|nr:hypothetical protein [Gemmatimonadota bacterium]
MESEVLKTMFEALKAISETDPQPIVDEIKKYIDLERDIEEIVDYISDRFGIRKEELEPIIRNAAFSARAGSPQITIRAEAVPPDSP